MIFDSIAEELQKRAETLKRYSKILSQLFYYDLRKTKTIKAKVKRHMALTELALQMSIQLDSMARDLCSTPEERNAFHEKLTLECKEIKEKEKELNEINENKYPA